VYENPWPGFGAQRNHAADLATGDWILEVDCDERVAPPLRDELARMMEAPPAGVEIGAIPLRHRLFGRALGPSTKYPEYRLRLFRRGAYRHDEGRAVHEGLEAAGPVWVAEGELEHLLAESWRELVGDAWRYARLEASQIDPPHTLRPYLLRILIRPAIKAVFRLLLMGGWRDGPVGVAKVGVECASDAVVWSRALGRWMATGAARPRRGPATSASARGRGRCGSSPWRRGPSGRRRPRGGWRRRATRAPTSRC